jgi:hypothetical protein
MNKIKLLYREDQWSNLQTNFFEPLWNQYFERIPIEDGKSYDKSHMIYADFRRAEPWIYQWKDQGFKVIVDHCWDSYSYDHWHQNTEENLFVLISKNWSWINESLWYASLGYDKYIPKLFADKSFLMLMNLQKCHRDRIYDKLLPILDDAIYSYHGRDITLQGSTDLSKDNTQWQRYINPDWYDATKFSVVVETGIDDLSAIDTRLIHTVAYSEKSYKPIAFKHPTISWASPGMLKYLKNQGFVTFDHVIDESYDNTADAEMRLNKVCKEIYRLNQSVKDEPNYFTDKITKDKLDHNWNLFYNKKLVTQKFKEELVDPILEFYERS